MNLHIDRQQKRARCSTCQITSIRLAVARYAMNAPSVDRPSAGPRREQYNTPPMGYSKTAIYPSHRRLDAYTCAVSVLPSVIMVTSYRKFAVNEPEANLQAVARRTHSSRCPLCWRISVECDCCRYILTNHVRTASRAYKVYDARTNVQRTDFMQNSVEFVVVNPHDRDI